MKKREKRKYEIMRGRNKDLSDSMKCNNTSIIRVPEEEEERERGRTFT